MKISELHFYLDEKLEYNDKLFYAYFCGYRITVVDRMTGYGNGQRDTETGLLDYRLPKDRNFWLASCMFDIRDYPDLTIEEAIKKIKECANTVDPDRKELINE